MANTPPKPDPELTRAMIRAALIEAVFIGLGVAAYLVTGQTVMLFIGAMVGGAVLLAIILPAIKASKRRRAEQAGAASIVEDGGL